jgi:hypothetical protein
VARDGAADGWLCVTRQQEASRRIGLKIPLLLDRWRGTYHCCGILEGEATWEGDVNQVATLREYARRRRHRRHPWRYTHYLIVARHGRRNVWSRVGFA